MASSSFFELNVAMSGLFAAQRGLSVTGNNITNATTPGYSRQVLEQKASFPMSGHGIGMVGTGVDTIQVSRVRNSYLDSKLWAQNDSLGEYRVKAQQNALVESVFGEPSDAGFTKVFNDMYKAIDDLSKLPSEGERKEALRQMLNSFTKYYNSGSQSLSDFQKDLNFEVGAMVGEINMLATRIQSLNKQIYQAEMYGDVANTLRDERELCVDRLSELINVEAQEIEYTAPDGRKELRYQVKVNGQSLVDHFDARFLDVKARETKQNGQDVDGLYDIVWEDGLDFKIDKELSGELRGALDMRDGCGTGSDNTYRGIPYYIKKMDQFVTGFAEEMNKIYNQGPDGQPLTNADGSPKYVLFVGDTAKGFALNPDILNGTQDIRTNFAYEPPNANPNESNNDLLLALLGTKSDNHMFKEGDPKDFMISMFSELGINAKEAKMYETSQTNITNVIKNQRMSVSQVDTNEEFMNLVKYNQAYQVAAKLITTMDGIYETTIFKLGSW
ncbi:MAG: flagellar hook-associated protein FlgK [Cellulosilyticaceae bacterium]